jgi:hypothetical protein
MFSAGHLLNAICFVAVEILQINFSNSSGNASLCLDAQRSKLDYPDQFANSSRSTY